MNRCSRNWLVVSSLLVLAASAEDALLVNGDLRRANGQRGGRLAAAAFPLPDSRRGGDDSAAIDWNRLVPSLVGRRGG